MKFQVIRKLSLHFILTFVSFSAFFSGLSILFKDKERIVYENSFEYISKNSPHYSLLFEYSPKPSINNLKVNNSFKQRVNYIDSTYFNKSTFFNVTEDIEFAINGYAFISKLSDTSYSAENPIVSTHRLKLISGSKRLDDAFFEGENMFSLNADSIEAHIYDEYKLQSYLGTDLIDNSDVTWTIDNESVAKVDEKGRVLVKNEGQAIITATFEDHKQQLNLNVINKDTPNKGFITAIPVVLPTSIVDKAFSDRDEIIGNSFASSINGQEYNFKVGGFYDSSVEDSFYKDNICEFIYFPRSERYFVPIETCYLRYGGGEESVKKIYGEIQLLKRICGLKFDFLEDAPVNQFKVNEITLYEKVNKLHRSWQLIVLPISLLGLALTTFYPNLLYLHDKTIRKLLPISTYIFGVGLPLLMLYIIKHFTFNGLKVSLLTPFVGWIAITVSIIATLLIVYRLIKQENKKLLNIDIPILNGTKNCIYIAKGAYLPNQNASALRVNSIIETLMESGYAFHVIGQANYPKGSITKLKDGYFLHSTLDKSTSVENTLFDKIESLYFPSDLIYDRVLKIVENNKIDYVFIYQTLPVSLVERLYQLSLKKHFKLIFDIVEYQTLSQQRNLGIIFNYFPSKKILTKYTKYGKTIAISTYLRDFLKEKNRSVIFVPFIFDVEKMRNSKYTKSDKLRIIYAGSAIGKRDTVQNVIKGINQLSEDETQKFTFSFAGLTRDDMKALGATEDELKNSDLIVNYYGVIPHEDVLDLYSKSDYSLLLKPADKRFSKAGFPTKMSESWALSTPVIANYSGDIGEYLVNEVNGIVCDSDSPEDFAKALRNVLRISEQNYSKMRTESRKTAISKLNNKVYSKLLKDFIEKD